MSEDDPGVDEGGEPPAFSNVPNISALGDPGNLTFNVNAQLTNYDQSLHVHQAMTLPDPSEAERFQTLFPGFMEEVMEGRRREQRARLMREKRSQEFEAQAALLRIRNAHEGAGQMRKLEHDRFNAAIAMMGLVALLFAVVGVIALLRGMYWSAGSLGLGLAYVFSRIVQLLQFAKK